MTSIQKGIDRANVSAVSNAAKIQRWTILPTDLSIAGGELGPTLKLKRYFFNQKYEEAIEKLYRAWEDDLNNSLHSDEAVFYSL